MNESSPSPFEDHLRAGANPPAPDALRPTLDRIAAALERQNALTEKKGGGNGGDKKEGAGEGGDKKEKAGEPGKGGEPEQKKEPGKLKRFLTSFAGIVAILIVVTLLVIAGLALYHYERTHASTDDAYTAGHVHQISPRINGLVTDLLVDDNQHVRAGDVLIKLDPKDYEVALERAKANLAESQAQVTQAQGQLSQAEAAILQAKAQVTQARAAVDQAGANFEVAGVNYGRASSLYGKDLRAVAKADVDTSKSTLDANKASFEGAKANVEAAEANVAAATAAREGRAADLKAAEAAVSVAVANVDNAQLQVSYCSVYAPCDGRVSRRTVETGQQLSPGQAIMSITPDIVWVLANYKETQLQHIRVGMTVKIPVDAFAGHPFTGKVNSIQNGSGATYSLLPPDNATGNFTKIVQRVPVKITFDPASIKGYEDLVVPGLSCEPVIDLSSRSDRGDYVSAGDPAPPPGKHQQ
jgi:membrane fusion protein (multidrug efflux system)